MRLMSKERESYDYLFSNDNTDQLFIRKNELFPYNKNKEESINYYNHPIFFKIDSMSHNINTYISYELLYFCGRTYVIPQLYEDKDGTLLSDSYSIFKRLDTYKVFYGTRENRKPTKTDLNINELLKLLFKSENDFLTNKKINKYDKKRYMERINYRKLVEWHKMECDTKIFKELNCAYFKETIDVPFIWTVQNSNSSQYQNSNCIIEKYPSLDKLKFNQILDANNIYQEIEMFVNGVLLKEEISIDISDKDLRDSKGFDEYSFKKRKID